MKKLIIAEKPSLGRKIMSAIGNSFHQKDGFAENNDYIVTWCFGHLFSLKDIDEYSPNYNPNNKNFWTLDNLPFVPNKFEFKVKSNPDTKSEDVGILHQIEIIKNLCNRQDVGEIVNAGDSDREGEIIVRLVLDQVGNTKPVKRLWLPEQTSKAINTALKNMKDDSYYDNIANEGFARTYIDWIYGINLTRFATVKSHKLLRVGRVTSAMIKAIYDRDIEIRNFVPKKYFQCVSKEKTHGEVIQLISKHEYDSEKQKDAIDLCNKYNRAVTKVTDCSSEVKIIPPGKLYSLTELQGVASKELKLPPNDTLKVVQSLYEKGLVTYPRTDTEYLSELEKEDVANKINIIANTLNVPIIFKDDKNVFDSSKVESHSALTPTENIPNIDALPKLEKEVYSLILNRFIAIFCSEPCEVNRSKLIIDNGYEKFSLTGDIMIKKGWTAFDINTRKDTMIPNLKVGDIVNVNFMPVEKETQPPKHYTVKSFNDFLKNPFKNSNNCEQFSDEDDYKAIMSGAQLGTAATRGPLIESAINNKYIELKNNTYYITSFGEYYIKTLTDLGIDMTKEKTVETGIDLKKVNKSQISIEDAIYKSKESVYNTIMSGINTKVSGYFEAEHDICKCPKCGHSIDETFKGYSCTNPDCGLTLYKNDKYFGAFGKKIDTKIAKELFTNKSVFVKGLKSKKGNIFDARINADFSEQYVKYTLVFDELDREPIGKCPRCGGTVFEMPKAFSCENKNCDFVLFKQDNFLKALGKNMTKTAAKDFLNKGQSLIRGLKSTGTNTKFDAIVHVDFSDKYPKYTLEFLTENKK